MTTPEKIVEEVDKLKPDVRCIILTDDKEVAKTVRGIAEVMWQAQKPAIERTILKALQAQREELVEMLEGIETWKCTDMGVDSSKYVVVKKEALSDIIKKVKEG